MSVKNLVQVANDCAVSAESLEETRQEILSLYADIIDLGKKVALSVFRIGEMLTMISFKMNGEEFNEFLHTLPFSERVASNYIKLYCYFQDSESLSDLTVMQAYAIAGISGRKELSAPPTTVDAELIDGEEIHTAGKTDDEAAAKERKKRARRLFKLPPLSGIELKNYRLNFEDGNFMLWEKSGRSTFVCELSLPNVEPESADVLKRNVQIELEKYFAILDESGWMF